MLQPLLGPPCLVRMKRFLSVARPVRDRRKIVAEIRVYHLCPARQGTNEAACFDFLCDRLVGGRTSDSVKNPNGYHHEPADHAGYVSVSGI
jgi:hypothetical protein